MYVREATADDRAAVANVLDGAVLETDSERLVASIERGETFVAVSGEPGNDGDGDRDEKRNEDSDERVLGALVLDGDRIVSVAVRQRRRGQRIGTALVERALAERGHLVAAFDERVRPFYESLGFEIEPIDTEGERFRGHCRRE